MLRRMWNVRICFNSSPKGINYYAPDRTGSIVYERVTPEILIEEFHNGKYDGYYAGVIHVSRPMSAARARRMAKAEEARRASREQAI